MVGLNDPLGPVIGARSAKTLETAFGMRSVGDLLLHAPRRLATRGELTPLNALLADSQVTIIAEVVKVEEKRMKQNRGNMLVVQVTDGTGVATLTFFRQTYHKHKLKVGERGMFSGKVSYFNRTRQLVNPDFMMFSDYGTGLEEHAREERLNELIPIYPATATVASWRVGQTIRHVRDLLDPVPGAIPAEVQERRGLMSFNEALRALHAPQTTAEWEAAKQRFAWEEAVVLQGVMARRRQQLEALSAHARIPTGNLTARFDARLPFELTDGQRVIGEQIEADLARSHPMHRLLQGEVGSGKTIVALRAMLRVVDAGGQCALLAPTEVLAQQHFRTLRTLLGPLGRRGEIDGDPDGTQVVLLTGSANSAQRRQALLACTSGDAGIVVGTHALLEDRVQFFDLGLVIVDEQHRFGVEQRAALATKARDDARPHTLVMTATPIPRTAAITIFGDLEISTLSELPKGRSPISTFVVPTEKPHFEERMWQRLREEVAKGHQAYVVCPRISAKDNEEGVVMAAAEDVFLRLQRHELQGLRLGLMHGRMSADDKDDVMRRFAQPTAADGVDVLVATTVVEVGVDVPNASTMVILDADRFGISQLHQLRGRVGRGAVPGICFLHTQLPTYAPGVPRLEAVADTGDGFELAHLDLEQRGEGDVLGVSQSGSRSSLRVLSVLRDSDIIAAAREEVVAVFAADPTLAQHPELAAAIEARERLVATEYLEKT